jgi:hypothetical protein
MPTTASLLEMMAQDIFMTFMFEAASIMDNLSDVCVRQPPSSSGDSILRNPNATSSELGNVHIDALARILCESGLASEEAALMSIVPAFFHHGKLPTLDASIARLLNDAKKLRREGQYQRGEAHLKSLLRICSPDHHEKVVRALGELCREASRSPSEFHRDFGLRAMAGMRQLKTQGVTALSQAAAKTLEDYHQLFEFLKQDPRHGGKPWEAKPRPALDMASVAELRGDTDLPRDKRSRVKALLMLKKYDISGRHSLAVQEFLFVAIALGYAEVIEDVRALNPSLLFDLPSSEVPPGEREPLTVAVQKKFKAGGKVESLDPKGKKPKGYLRSAAPIAFLATLWAASQLELEDRAPGEAEDVLKAMLGWASITKADLTDGQNNTPLMYAARSTDGVLKDYGTAVQTVLNNSYWSYERAPEQEKKLEALIAAGCDVNLNSPEWKATPLQIICARSRFFKRQVSVLNEVAVAEKDNLASMLLRAGAKVNLTAADLPGKGRRLIRSTPLELACLTGKADVVQALLNAGAEVNTPGGEFGPPLQAACMQFGQRNEFDTVEIVRTLLAAGANINAVSAPCGTALAAATHSLLPELVEVLLDAGADPSLDIQDSAGGEYRDAWDALQQPHGRLVKSLRDTFQGMQTGPFTCIPVPHDSAGERWERIRDLLMQHAGTDRPAKAERGCPTLYLRERVQSICVQDEFKRLSPEEIRWRHRWKPGQRAEEPLADGIDPKVPQDPLPFYGFIGLDAGAEKGTVAVQHISSQHPYSEHSADEVRLWDYDAGLRYPPADSSS